MEVASVTSKPYQILCEHNIGKSPTCAGVSAQVLADISGGDSRRGIFSSATPADPLPTLPPAAVGTLAPPTVTQGRPQDGDPTSESPVDGGGRGHGGMVGFGGEGTVKLSCLGHHRIKAPRHLLAVFPPPPCTTKVLPCRLICLSSPMLRLQQRDDGCVRGMAKHGSLAMMVPVLMCSGHQ